MNMNLFYGRCCIDRVTFFFNSTDVFPLRFEECGDAADVLIVRRAAEMLTTEDSLGVLHNVSVGPSADRVGSIL